MNSLGSWIDQEAFVGLARDVAPPAADETRPWFADQAAPVTRLAAEDFHLPDHFASAPFPEAPAAMPAPEREKVRNFLDSIRHKAELSGLIGRSPAGDPAAAQPDPAPSRPRPSAGTFHGGSAGGSVGVSAGGSVGGSAPSPLAWAPAVASARSAPLPGAAPPPRRHVPHFEVPLGPLATRLRALTDWIRRQIDAADIFFIDAQGCPVSDREAAGEIVAGAVLLAEAARRAAPHLPSAAEGAIYLDLQDERRLCVIDTATRHGTFTLGLIVPDALVPRAADRLRRALRRTVEAESQALSLPPREHW